MTLIRHWDKQGDENQRGQVKEIVQGLGSASSKGYAIRQVEILSNK